MKNKKSTRIFILFFAAFMFLGCSPRNNESKVPDRQENAQPEYVMKSSLSLKRYVSDKGYFPEDGFVSTPEMAVQVADIVLSNIYGKNRIERQKPFYVNLENDIWLIEGYLEPDRDGGVAYMEIRKSNGEILKVTHGK